MNKLRPAISSKQRSGALHLTQKVDYGMTLLTTLVEGTTKDSKSIKAIADEQKLSFAFLQKIARMLQQSGIIKAERGKYGGYTLTRPAEKITIKDIIEALEGPIALVPCLCPGVKGTCGKGGNCAVRPGLEKINIELQKFFAERTLKNLIST